MRGKPLSDFLHTGGIGELIPQAENLLALRRAVTRLLPSNLRAARVANLKAGTLVLQAGNNAVAAKLKHCGASLIEGLAREGYHITKVKVEVLPDYPADVSARRIRPLPQAAAEALRKLESGLPADSPLREAVHALANKAR